MAKPHLVCHNCGEKGHYSNKCPHPKKETATVNAIAAEPTTPAETPSVAGECIDLNPPAFHFVCYYKNVLTTTFAHLIPPTWILLDNQSTIDVFSNPDLLSGIHKVDRTMNIYCNAGLKQTSEIASLPGYGEVWFNTRYDTTTTRIYLPSSNEMERNTFSHNPKRGCTVWILPLRTVVIYL